MKSLAVALLIGCGPAEPEPPQTVATTPSPTVATTATTTDATSTTTTGFTLTETFVCRQDVDGSLLHGSYPPSELPVATFEALSHEGLSRTSADLLGHPTVIWFYPMAGTPG